MVDMIRSKENQEILYLGEIAGHTGPVTCIDTFKSKGDEHPQRLITGSRDKSVRLWELSEENREISGLCKKAFRGHSHAVEDITLCDDGRFCLSASWDHTLRLWPLGDIPPKVDRFVGHTKDVLSVSFSPDNTKIVSGSRDGTIKLWNTIGQCKYTIKGADAHTDWVSCIRFSPVPSQARFVSCGWDGLVKVWDLNNLKLVANLPAKGYLNTVTVSPDGSLCASGGKDGTAMLWDLNEGIELYSLHAGDIIHDLVFSPVKYWLCAATDKGVRIWDLESKVIVDELNPEFPPVGKKAVQHYCCSLKWTDDGRTLFCGYTDGKIRVWRVVFG